MILTTLNPTTLIVGKIISLFLVGLVQIGVFLTPIISATPSSGTGWRFPTST